MPPSPLFRSIPSVERLVQALGEPGVPRPVAVAVARRELSALRARLAAGEQPVPTFDEVLGSVRRVLERLKSARLRPVINATGIPLHTNLGRAPLASSAVAAVAAVAANYNNLEYDLAAGARGSRAAYLEHNLALAVGAEAATVVNNCAAALVLMLRHYTRGSRKEVVISRGELVQIGGGFRVPEIMEASGAKLREIGTTNQTSVADYDAAVNGETALILSVHRSNFYLAGFAESPGIAELAKLARRRRIPLVEDLGSGALADTARATAAAALGHERTPQEAIRDGVEAVCFSGDKLLGGPQAGIIAGKERRVAAFKREPFFRALRCDKMALAALEITVDLYLAEREADIPALRMLRIEVESLRRRAEAIVDSLRGLPCQARVGTSLARVGGGTMPRAELPSITVDLFPGGGWSLRELAGKLRYAEFPVIGFVSGDRLRLDLRTVFPEQDGTLAQTVRQVFAEDGSSGHSEPMTA